MLERTAWGKYVAIHTETGAYVVADTEEDVMEQFRAQFPGVFAHTLRIGIPRLMA
jgi:hypothetical protein